MNSRTLYLVYLFLIVLQNLILPWVSHADHLEFGGNLSLWWNIYEENENGIIQPRTGKPAADVASGFNLKQGRTAFDYRDDERRLSARIQVGMEDRVALLDCYLSWNPASLFNLYLGQMKVPTTYEAIGSDAELDFISRTTLSKNLTDWSLSRAPYYSALYGSRSYNRDLGIGVKGMVGPAFKRDLASCFLMVGNGLGANLFIGGRESKEFMFSNDPGDYFYGIRIDTSPLDWLTFGGHYSLNRHDNVLFNDEKTVFDLDRYSWSMDSHLELLRFRFSAMYGAGEVNDDYFYATERDLNYSGYETKLLIWLIDSHLQFGIRYDVYTCKGLESALSTDQKNLTMGLNITPTHNTRCQLNYTLKKTDDRVYPDLADNILYLNLQHSFNKILR